MSHRTALVTGGSRGIGRAIAAGLAAAGYDLTISGRNQEALDAAAVQLRASGGQVRVIAANMADPEDVKALANAQLSLAHALDVLVIAAGAGIAGTLEDYPLRRLDAQVSVNLRAPFQLVQCLLPALRAAAIDEPHPGAKIIAIASITGTASEPGLAAYGATKAALISLCESITASEGTAGVNATAISPGYVDTDMTAWIRDRLDPAEMIRVDDIAEIALAICRLSRYAAIPNIVVTRPGGNLWRA